MKKEPVIIERTFNSSIKKVWKAITDKKEMKKWYFDIPEFKPEVGSKFQFSGEGKDSSKYLHLCEVKEVIVPKRLSYSWRYENFEGDSLVTFELFEKGSKTILKVTHSGLETFPKSNPNLGRENFVEGWNYIIGTSLKKYFQKKK